jgi:hypothetical protein
VNALQKEAVVASFKRLYRMSGWINTLHRKLQPGQLSRRWDSRQVLHEYEAEHIINEQRRSENEIQASTTFSKTAEEERLNEASKPTYYLSIGQIYANTERWFANHELRTRFAAPVYSTILQHEGTRLPCSPGYGVRSTENP